MYFDDKDYLFMDDSVSVHNGHATENWKNENEIKRHPAGEVSDVECSRKYLVFHQEKVIEIHGKDRSKEGTTASVRVIYGMCGSRRS